MCNFAVFSQADRSGFMFQVVMENDRDDLLDEFVEFQLLPDDELPTAGSTDEQWTKIGKLNIQATGTAMFA